MRKPFIPSQPFSIDGFEEMCRQRIVIRCLVQNTGSTLPTLTTNITLVTKARCKEHPESAFLVRVKYSDQYAERDSERFMKPIEIDEFHPSFIGDAKPAQEVMTDWLKVSSYWLIPEQIITCEQIEAGPITLLEPAVGLRILEHLSRVETQLFLKEVDETLLSRLTGFIEHHNRQWERIVSV